MNPPRQHARHPRAARHGALRQELADRSAAAHADEQSRSRRRRTSGRARGLWRHRPRRARLGRLSTASSRRLKRLEADETLLVQSGKPVGVFRTHADAPRVLIANSNLVPHWATWDHFNELDRKGLMMYGQMTAGSWIYIGTQGIVQGTYETFVEMGRKHYRRRPHGQMDPDRRPRRHGRRAAARRDHGRRLDARRRMPADRRIEFRLRTGYRRRAGQDLDEALAIIDRATKAGEADLGRPARQCRRSLARARAARRPARHRHRPDLRARSAQRLSAEGLDAGRMGASGARAIRKRRRARGARLDGRACARHARILRMRRADASTTATTSARWRWRRASRTPSTFPASCRPISARCSAAASGRSAGSRFRAIRRTSTRPTPR